MEGEDLIRLCREIDLSGLSQFGEGNASIRAEDGMLITPTLNDYSQVTAEELVSMDLAGERIEGPRPPSSEWKLHSRIYQQRPKARCIIHAHSEYASALSVAEKPIPVILEEMVIFLGGGVDVSPFASAGTWELGDAALSAMGDRNAALMANHGMVAAGRDIASALKGAKLTEKMAKVLLAADAAGGANAVPDEAIAPLLGKFKELFSIV